MIYCHSPICWYEQQGKCSLASLLSSSSNTVNEVLPCYTVWLITNMVSLECIFMLTSICIICLIHENDMWLSLSLLNFKNSDELWPTYDLCKASQCNKAFQATLNKKYISIIHNHDHYWLRWLIKHLKKCDQTPVKKAPSVSHHCREP